MADNKLKGIIVGEAGVGKSSILMRFERNLFSNDFRTTIGISFVSKTVIFANMNVQFNICDTAGQERFRRITSSHYRNVDFVVIVYDITDRRSFERVKYWIEDACEHAPESAELFILGNKCDSDTSRQITHAEGVAFASDYDLHFSETSAKANRNIDSVFDIISNKILLTEPLVNCREHPKKSRKSKQQTKIKRLSRKLRKSLLSPTAIVK